MARKRTKKAPCSKPTPTAPSAKARAGAHSRLVHGFLVNRVSGSAIATKAAAAGLPGLFAILARAQSLDDATSEGPAGGATFH
jgi:hypothetical protein